MGCKAGKNLSVAAENLLARGELLCAEIEVPGLYRNDQPTVDDTPRLFGGAPTTGRLS
jgi:hypothetical protein